MQPRAKGADTTTARPSSTPLYPSSSSVHTKVPLQIPQRQPNPAFSSFGQPASSLLLPKVSPSAPFLPLTPPYHPHDLPPPPSRCHPSDDDSGRHAPVSPRGPGGSTLLELPDTPPPQYVEFVCMTKKGGGGKGKGKGKAKGKGKTKKAKGNEGTTTPRYEDSVEDEYEREYRKRDDEEERRGRSRVPRILWRSELDRETLEILDEHHLRMHGSQVPRLREGGSAEGRTWSKKMDRSGL